MRVFLALCSLAAVALATPQYNYGNGVSGTFGSGSSGGLGGGFSGLGSGSSGGGGHRFSGGNSGPSLGFGTGGGGSSFGSGSHGGGGSSFGSGSHGGGGSSFGSGSHGIGSSFGSGSHGGGGSSFGSGSHGGGSPFGSGSIGGGSGGGSSFGGASSYNQGGGANFEAPLVHKQFINVAAPEDHDDLEQTKHLVIGRPQKNYRVVFIKAPSSSNANVRLSAEYAPKEEKTVIYVLSKKDNQLEVGDIATPAPTIPSKPEVFFIKYKTEEEAQHAQRQIQAEYDRIEGSSEHTDAGVAQQQSVVGILGNSGAGLGSGSGSGSFNAGSSGSFNSGSSGFFAGGGPSSSNFGSNSGSFGTGIKTSAYLPPVTQ